MESTEKDLTYVSQVLFCLQSQNLSHQQNHCNISVYADMLLSMRKTVHIFKALGDETRLRILALLCKGELCVCDLMAVLNLPQSTVSRHLASLRNAGWVEDRRQGVWMHYRLAAGRNRLHRQLAALLAERLQEIPMARADAEKLQKFLATKKEADCG